MLWKNEEALLAAATALAETLNDDPNHTVAAAAMDLQGNIYSAVNDYHFTGGPCAELVVLGLAATAKAGPLAYMVAVGNEGRGVIAPCGRCRQVMLDQHPDCYVIVPFEESVKTVPVRQLLPYAFIHPDGNAARFVTFSGKYYGDVLSGKKTRTIRYLDPLPLGAVPFVFEDPDRLGFRLLRGVIESKKPIDLSDLDADYQAGLREHYPDLPENALLDDVRFHLEQA